MASRRNSTRSVAPIVPIAQQTLPFTATDGQAFVRLTYSSGGWFTLPVRSQAFREWFFAAFYRDFGTPPRRSAYRMLLNHLESQATVDPLNQRRQVWRRIGSRGSFRAPERILLDLSNPEGQIVEISSTGWNVVCNEQSLFQTSRSTIDLPVPQLSKEDPTAVLETLRSCLNLASRADWLRCLTWLLQAFRPSGPFPILVLQGPPGSGKTVAARFLRYMIDPATAPFLPIPRNSRQLLSLARHNWVLAFDHVSALSTPLTDSLCRLTSGAGAAVPETSVPDPSRDPLLQYYRRPILLTVTDRWSPPPDLARRALTVTLPALPASACRPESELLQVLSNAHSSLLGAVCSVLSTAMERISSIEAPTGSLHPDALAWAMAAAPALGCRSAEIRHAIAQTAPHPFLDAVHRLLGTKGQWTGSASDLLAALPSSTEYESPRGLSQYLHNNARLLAGAGIQLRTRRMHQGARTIEIRRVEGDANPAMTRDLASPKSSGDFQAADNKEPKEACGILK